MTGRGKRWVSHLAGMGKAPLRLSGKAVRGAKKRVVGRAKRILAEPEGREREASFWFALLKRYALFVGVNPILVERAEKIYASTRSLPDAVRFLNNFIKLERGRPPGDFYDNFLIYLETDDEKRLARDLIGLQLAETAHGSDDYLNLRMHLFRLEKARPDDPEVIEFVRENIEASIRKRLKDVEKEEGRLDPDKVRSSLIGAREAFHRHGKRFFLTGGTLLAAVRDKSFTSYFNKVEIGVFDGETSAQELPRLLSGAGFKLKREHESVPLFETPDGLDIEIGIYESIGNNYILRGHDDIHQWWFSEFGLDIIDIEGEKFWAPDYYEKYLYERYGNWRKRLIFYDYTYDAPNLVMKRNTKSIKFLTYYFFRAIVKGWRYWAQAPAELLRDQFDIDFTDHFPKRMAPPPIPHGCMRRTEHPIVILAAFDAIRPHMARILESAASMNRKVIAGVLSDKLLGVEKGSAPGPAEEKRLALARGLHYADEAHLVTDLSPESLSLLAGPNPAAVLMEEEHAHLLPEALLHPQQSGNGESGGDEPGRVRKARPEDERGGPDSEGARADDERPLNVLIFNEKSIWLTVDENGDLSVRNSKAQPGRARFRIRQI